MREGIIHTLKVLVLFLKVNLLTQKGLIQKLRDNTLTRKVMEQFLKVSFLMQRGHPLKHWELTLTRKAMEQFLKVYVHMRKVTIQPQVVGTHTLKVNGLKQSEIIQPQ